MGGRVRYADLKRLLAVGGAPTPSYDLLVGVVVEAVGTVMLLLLLFGLVAVLVDCGLVVAVEGGRCDVGRLLVGDRVA